jgi:hypothetical protein
MLNPAKPTESQLEDLVAFRVRPLEYQGYVIESLTPDGKWFLMELRGYSSQYKEQFNDRDDDKVIENWINDFKKAGHIRFGQLGSAIAIDLGPKVAAAYDKAHGI